MVSKRCASSSPDVLSSTAKSSWSKKSFFSSSSVASGSPNSIANDVGEQPDENRQFVLDQIKDRIKERVFF